MSRNFADIVRRVERGYGLPTSEARALLGRPLFTIALDTLTDEEASDVFVLRPALGTRVQGAVALEFSHVQYFNPPASGVIAIFDKFILDVSADAFGRIGFTTAALGSTGGAAGFKDRRVSGAPAIELRSDTNVAGQVTSLHSFRIEATVPTVLRDLGIIIPPGTGVDVELEAVNIQLITNAQWREETT